MDLDLVTQRDGLIVEYENYVRNLVAKLVKTMYLPVEMFDEYLSAGYLGLVEAAERYDFESGVDFKSYAFHRIRGAVIDSIRRCSDLTGRAYKHARALQAAEDLKEELWQALDSSADSEAGLAEILEYAAQAGLVYRLSLCDAEHEIAILSQDSETPESHLRGVQENKKFRDLVTTLPPKERLIIEEYYFNNKSFVEIVNEHPSLSKSWVSRLHARGLRRLKEIYLRSAEES